MVVVVVAGTVEVVEVVDVVVAAAVVVTAMAVSYTHLTLPTSDLV